MRQTRLALALAAALLLSGCDALPGRPRPGDRPLPPDQVLDFDALYAANCAGCHGREGRLGPARPLDDPLYLAWIPEAELRRVVAEGVPDSAMPAFARRSGGLLTEAQVDALSDGMRARWGQPPATAAKLPPYRAPAAGSAERGAGVYASFCAECHGPHGEGGKRGGRLLDGSMLALVSDQALRSAVVCGRIDLGMPAWREQTPARAMTPQEITDVVAWLAAQRVRFPGQLRAQGGAP